MHKRKNQEKIKVGLNAMTKLFRKPKLKEMINQTDLLDDSKPMQLK